VAGTDKACWPLHPIQERTTTMNPFIRSLASISILCAISAASAQAEDIKVGDLLISQSWSRATPGGAKVAGGYLTIENKGTAPDRLLGGTTDVAGKIEVHEMSMKDGVMIMRPLDQGLAIEPGKIVKLAPGGYHLMLIDLKGALKQGDKVPLTLQFEKAGKVQVSFDVQAVGAQTPTGADHGGAMDHGHSGMKK
jgi:hypothetical protein